MKPVPRPFFLALIAYAIVLAAFVALTLTRSPVVQALAILAALGATGFVAVLLARTMFADDPLPVPVKLDAQPLPCLPHLRVFETGRGFAHLPPLPNKYGGPEDIAAYEASNAEYAGIWLKVADSTANITAGTAWRLAEQLALLVANHYHGDQRPQSEETILSIDLSRLDTREEVDA